MCKDGGISSGITLVNYNLFKLILMTLNARLLLKPHLLLLQTSLSLACTFRFQLVDARVFHELFTIHT